MITPRRLLQEGTEFERQVLATARLDVASSESCKRMLAAMSAITSLGTATAGAAAGPSATLLGGPAVGVLVKWVGVGMVVGFAARGSAKWIESGAPARAPVAAPALSTASVSSEARAAPVAPPPTISSQRPIPTIAQPITEMAAPSRQLHARAPSPRTVPAFQPAPADPIGARMAAPPQGLDAEIDALAEVRALLGKGDPPAAMAKLDAYDRAFSIPLLADEATVLRVDALLLQGDPVAAARLAGRFLVSNPSSPHAPHLRAVMAGVQNP